PSRSTSWQSRKVTSTKPASASCPASSSRSKPWWTSIPSSWNVPSSASRSTTHRCPPSSRSSAKAASTGSSRGTWCSTITVTTRSKRSSGTGSVPRSRSQMRAPASAPVSTLRCMTARMPADVSARVTGPTASRSAWVTSPVPAPYSSSRVVGPSGTASRRASATTRARSTFAGSSSQVAAFSSNGSWLSVIGRSSLRAGSPHRARSRRPAPRGGGGRAATVSVPALETPTGEVPHGSRADRRGARAGAVSGVRHLVTYPLTAHPASPELLSREAIVRFARRAEELGFDAVGFTDHPAPSHRWLTHGGHDALDPFVALGVVAAVTERLRLLPHILVLPYRNPFLVAKAAATLDLVSEGRFTLAV